MTEFRKVTDHLSVAPQLLEKDIEAAAKAGFKTIICNRPDEEDPQAAHIETMKKLAEAQGMTFHALTFSGVPSSEIISQQGTLITDADGPVLAYCRTGTRSITAWALSQANKSNVQEIIEQARTAGYDLSGLAQRV